MTARDSTLSHMNRLIAAATVAGTVACNKCNSLPGGYAVVDPMPSPARCPGVVYGLTTRAALVTSDAGLLISLDIDGLTSSKTDFDLNDAGALRASVSNGVVMAQSWTGTGVHFTLRPAVSVGGMTLTIAKACDAGPASIVANVSWGTAPDGGQEVRITLSEY